MKILLGSFFLALSILAHGHGVVDANEKVLLEKILAEKLDGKSTRLTVLELEYPPGGATEIHRHPGPVIVYVLDGALESQVGDEPKRTYKKGSVFFEPTRALHSVSRNASKSKPARFLAVFLSPEMEKELTIPEKR